MYGFDQTTQETTAVSALQPGIVENVFLKEVKFQSMSEGKDPVLQITFGNNSGTLNSIMWPVDSASVTARDGATHRRDVPALGFVKGATITREDAVKMEFDNFNTRLKHIATKFVSEEEANVRGNSYAEFAKNYVALLDKDEFKSVSLRLKVTLNNKDYSQLPKYPPFVESMDVPREQSKLRITQYDKVVRSTEDAPTIADSPTNFSFSDDDLI